MQKTLSIPAFATEKNECFAHLNVAYTTHGALNEARDNAVFVVHPFTAHADPFVWWAALFGSGKVFDPARYFIICANIPGSPYGSTHPLDVNPHTGEKYYYDFPLLSPRDVVKAFEALLQSLEIRSLRLLIGASMGGQIAFQWLVSGAVNIQRAIIIAANEKTTPWMLASHHVQCNALYADPSWGALRDDAGSGGMKVARQIAFLSYRSPVIFSLFHTLNVKSNSADESGFALQKQDGGKEHHVHALKSYVEYQGDKFLQRFNAFSYHVLLKLMDAHDVGIGLSSTDDALRMVESNVLLVGVDSDILFPPYELRAIARTMKYARYREISSVYGHDAFLIEYKQLEDIIIDYLCQIDEVYSPSYVRQQEGV